MKIIRLLDDEAKDMIINSVDKGFYYVVLNTVPATIYRRIYKGKEIFIAEIESDTYKDDGIETVIAYYILDNDEAKQILNI